MQPAVIGTTERHRKWLLDVGGGNTVGWSTSPKATGALYSSQAGCALDCLLLDRRSPSTQPDDRCVDATRHRIAAARRRNRPWVEHGRAPITNVSADDGHGQPLALRQRARGVFLDSTLTDCRVNDVSVDVGNRSGDRPAAAIALALAVSLRAPTTRCATALINRKYRSLLDVRRYRRHRAVRHVRVRDA
jgi:hypothetical protein